MAKCEIGTAEALENAILNDVNDSKITLCSDIIVEKPIVITKSFTIDWWGYTVWYSEEPTTWVNWDKNYVFKIWSTDSEGIDVNLNNITVKNSFYWILDWFSNSISTKL